jgi:hypothetical protein
MPENINPKTKVIFRIECDNRAIAFFPELPGSTLGTEYVEVYVHMGQHSAAEAEWFDYTRPPITTADRKRVASLRAELTQAPFNYDFEDCEEWTEEMNTARREAWHAQRGRCNEML